MRVHEAREPGLARAEPAEELPCLRRFGEREAVHEDGAAGTDQVFERRVVAVDGAERNAGAAGDVVNTCLGNPALAVAGARRLEDPLPSSLDGGSPLPHLIFSLAHIR